MKSKKKVIGKLIPLAVSGLSNGVIQDVTRRGVELVNKQLFTELTISSKDESFYDILKWVERNFKGKRFHSLKLSNGRWGYEKKSTLSFGYGKHMIDYRGKKLTIEMRRDETVDKYDNDSIVISVFGRDKRIFEKLIDDVTKSHQDKDVTRVYKFDGHWEHIKDQPARKLNTVLIDKVKKDAIINRLEKFIGDENWYKENGIPYQLGILLYGPAGTGKTSIIKSIACHMQYPIYYIPASGLSEIEVAMSRLPNDCIVVIEDIDSSMITHSRDGDNPIEDLNETTTNKVKTKIPEPNVGNEIMSQLVSSALSDVLNSLDGFFSANGRILVATTNHIEKLDSALIRAGRIDLKVEIGYVTIETFKMFMDKFYLDNGIVYNRVSLKSELTISELQNLVLEGKPCNEVLSFATVEEEI